MISPHPVTIELNGALDKLSVRCLRDGRNSHIKFLDVSFSAGNGLPAAGTVELTQFLLHDADAVKLSADAHKISGIDQGANLDALFNSVLDLDLISRHILNGTTIQDDHFAGPQTDGSTSGVDGGVAAANDSHTLASEVQIVFQEMALQEVQAMIYTF